MGPSRAARSPPFEGSFIQTTRRLAVLATLTGLVLLAALLLAVRLVLLTASLLLAALSGLVLLLLALAGATLTGLVVLTAALVAALLLAVRVVLFLVRHRAFPFVCNSQWSRLTIEL